MSAHISPPCTPSPRIRRADRHQVDAAECLYGYYGWHYGYHGCHYARGSGDQRSPLEPRHEPRSSARDPRPFMQQCQETPAQSGRAP